MSFYLKLQFPRTIEDVKRGLTVFLPTLWPQSLEKIGDSYVFAHVM